MKLTLKNIFIWGGAVLLVVAFFLGFAMQLTGEIMGYDTAIKGIGFGTPTLCMSAGGLSEEEALEDGVHAGLAIAGLIMMLVGGLGAAAIPFIKDKKYFKWIVFGIAGVVFVGAIFVFCFKGSYINSYTAYEVAEYEKAVNHDVTAEDIKEIREEVEEIYKDFKPNAAVVISGILGILGAGAIAFSQFTKKVFKK